MKRETYSGSVLNLADPQPEDINITDIARALGMTCRFTGHVEFFYSVAQHSVLLSHLVEPGQAYLALMHDAAEAYIGDVISPLKAGLSEYKSIEKRLEAAVFNRFNVPWNPADWDAVMKADLRLLATEKKFVVQTDNPWPAVDCHEPFDVDILSGWSPETAREVFLTRWKDLEVGN